MNSIKCPCCSSSNVGKMVSDGNVIGLLLKNIDEDTITPNVIHTEMSVCLDCKYVMLFANDIGNISPYKN